MGKSSSPKTMAAMTNQQKVINNEMMNFLKGKLAQGATPLSGPLQVQFQRAMGMIADSDPNLLTGLQTKALQNILAGASTSISESKATRYFDKFIASPAYEMFDKHVAPRVKQQFAGSGAAFSSRQGDAVTSSLGDLTSQLQGQFGGMLQQILQQNAAYKEAALGRQMQAANAVNPQLTAASGLFSSLQPAYTEFMRMAPESNPYLPTSLSYIGQSQAGVYNQAQRGGIGGALGGALAGGMAAPMLGGMFGAGSGVAAGAASGGLAGMSAGLGGGLGTALGGMGSIGSAISTAGGAAAGAAGGAAAGAGMGSMLGPLGLIGGGLLGALGIFG